MNLRNEMEADFNGRPLKLRATFFALNDIENRSKKTLQGLMLAAMNREKGLSLNDVSCILFGGLIGADNKVSPTEVQEMVMEMGYAAAMPIALQFLTVAVQKPGQKAEEIDGVSDEKKA